MMRLAAIWRHPIKAHGAEPLERIRLAPGQGLPLDRGWAVVRAGGAADGAQWVPCGQFSRGAVAPALMAITARRDEGSGTLTLRHPERPDLAINPDTEAGSAALVAWLAPLSGHTSAPPARLVRALAQPMTDTAYPSISLLNCDSLDALSEAAGRGLDARRFRGNLWVEGAAAWAEEGWIGQELRVGDAVLRVLAPIGRCRATEANPETGKRDTETLALLRDLRGAANFGVYAEVVSGGPVALGDHVTLGDRVALADGGT